MDAILTPGMLVQSINSVSMVFGLILDCDINGCLHAC